MSKIKRGDLDWCESGYRSIREVVFEGVVYRFGKSGSVECLLDDNLNPRSGEPYHEITIVPESGNVYLIGRLGAMKYLLNKDGECISGNGYHDINLTKEEAKTGSVTYHFREHLGDSSVRIKPPSNNPLSTISLICVFAFLLFSFITGC